METGDAHHATPRLGDPGKRRSTPEALVLRRRGAALAGAARAVGRRAGAALPRRRRPAPRRSRRWAPGRATPKYTAGRAADRGERRRPPTTTTTNSAKTRTSGARLRRCTQRPWSIEHRRHGGQAAHHRHRRPAEAGAARGAGLPPPLRRGLGDDRALDRLPAQRSWSSWPSRWARRNTSCSRPSQDQDRCPGWTRRSIPGRTSRA